MRYSSEIIIIKDFIAGLHRFDARETTNTRNSPTLRILKKETTLKNVAAKNRATQAWLGNANAMARASVERGAHIVLIGNPDSRGVS